jgi:hypothetical protein
MAWRQSNNVYMRVTGTGDEGSSASQLRYPQGLFVDDALNHRIQRFGLGKTEAMTVAGIGAPGTTDLSGLTAVLLDADGYLFIVEYYAHRVVASGPYGFRCILGCTEFLVQR